MAVQQDWLAGPGRAQEGRAQRATWERPRCPRSFGVEEGQAPLGLEASPGERRGTRGRGEATWDARVEGCIEEHV